MVVTVTHCQLSVLLCVAELNNNRDHMQIRHTVLSPFLHLQHLPLPKNKDISDSYRPGLHFFTHKYYSVSPTELWKYNSWRVLLRKCNGLLYDDCTYSWCLLLPYSFAAARQLICDSFIKYTYTCLSWSIQTVRQSDVFYSVA